MLRRPSHDGALDVEQLPYPLQGLARDRRLVGGMDVKEVAPRMRPAGDLGHDRRLPLGGLVERPEAGIAIGLQEALEAGQMRARMLAFAVGRVAIDDRRWRLAGVGPFIAQIDP